MTDDEYAVLMLPLILAADSDALSELGGQIGVAHVEGRISDATALFLIEQVEERKAKAALDARNTRLVNFLDPVVGTSLPEPRALEKEEGERLRRRRARAYLAKVSAIPAALAYSFTLSQQAVLAIIGRVCRGFGQCDYPVAWIAKVANVSERTVQTTLMLAKRRGLFTIKYRRRMTSVITVVHADWLRWWDQAPLSKTDSSSLFGGELNNSLKGANSPRPEEPEPDDEDDEPVRPVGRNVPPAENPDFLDRKKLKDVIWRLFPPDWPDRNAAGAAIFGRKKRLW